MSMAEKLTTVAENMPKVYEAGQRDVEKMFTGDGARYYYAYGFMQQDWSGFVFSKPLVPSGSIYNMFASYKGEYLPQNIDLSKALVTGTDAARLFYYASNLLEADCMGLKAGAALSSVFRGCEKLKKITGLNSNESNTFSSTFLECYALEEIEINGVIGTDIAFPDSPLSIASMNRIIACLNDYAGSGTTHTLTFKSGRLALLSDAEKAIATEKGWTLV